MTLEDNLSIVLRPYQERLLQECRHAIRFGIKRLLLCVPTGSGKTCISCKIIKGASAKGYRCIFLIHRVELLYQTAETFKKFGLEFGIIAPGFPATDAPVQIASIPTLARRLGKLPHFDLLVIDEAIHSTASQWRAVIDSWPDAVRIGLSATPARLSGEGFTDVFDVLVAGPSTADLITAGYLSPYKLYAPVVASFDDCRIKAGDYFIPEVEGIIDKPRITGDVIDHYTRLAPGKRAVVFCASIQHSKNVAAQFNAAGIVAAHIDGKTPDSERAQIVEDFKTNKIKVLCNVGLVTEGFDCPGIECVIVLRPTMSLALWLQICGRGLRIYPGKKELIILDHVSNVERHGLPDDYREWTLEGRVVKKNFTTETVPIRICKKCYAAVVPQKSCPYCGAELELSKYEIKQREGELIEMQKQERRLLRKEQGKAKTFAELIALGKARGYKNPAYWSRKVLAGRY